MDNKALFFVLLILGIIIYLALNSDKKEKKEKSSDITEMYVSKPILTDREYKFYKRLKPTAEKYGLQIFTKVRLADLVEPKPKEENPMWIQCFNKIKSKHIDFVLADEDTNIIVLIELDDRSHQRPDRIERDIFVNAVLENTGYKLLRTYGSIDEIEKYLK
ncbi:MAG: DUF2726 domain-containing protein [Ruminococcus sp.]|nr:DUF2726 domain-containing protein [Ruminococcus sp.]MBR6386071.1 DUF2726 domain-containing protein [Ruminococcus sp.]